jgi:tetratricopeptide (TPR) repeat protein
LDEAEAGYRAAMAGDDPDEAARAAVDLGSLLASRGRLGEAEAALLVAVDSGNAEAGLTATRYLAMVLRDMGRPDEAEQAFRRAIAAGHPFESGAAAVTLGVMLHDAGRLDDAEAAYRTAVSVGDPGVADVATGNLANLLRARGDRSDEVEATYRLAASSDDLKTRSIAQSNLADLLIGDGRGGEAEGLLRDAVAGGHPEVAPIAASKLGWRLMELGRREDAAAFLRQAVDSNDPDVRIGAAANLGVTLRDLDRPREAEEAFRVAAGLGDAGSTMELARLLEQRGQTDEAVELYRKLAERGSHPLHIEVGTKGLNRLLGTPDAPSPGVARVQANLGAIVAVLRRHGALFAFHDHQPPALSSMPGTDRTIAAWFDPDRPLLDPSMVGSEIGPVVDRVEVLNTAPLEAGHRIARTGRLILDDDRPARVAWLADIRMVALDQATWTLAGRPRSHAVDFLSAPEAPPARMADMLRFVRTYRQTVLDTSRRLRRSPHQLDDAEVLTRLRNAFFAAVIGCRRIAHIVIADNDWEPPATNVDVFNTLVERGIIGASVAEALTTGEDALDTMVPIATPDQVVHTCLDPTYMDSIEQFLDGAETQVAGRRRPRRWRRR